MAKPYKEALAAQIALHRNHLEFRGRALRQELNLTHQLKKSFFSHPKTWALGTAATAFLTTSLLHQKKIINPPFFSKRGVALNSTRLLFSLARPILATIALNYAKNHLGDKIHPILENSKLGDLLKK